jgi:hypothetical protein
MTRSVQAIAHWANPPLTHTRTVQLVGSYAWSDCLYTVDPPGPSARTYRHQSVLTNRATGATVSIAYLRYGGQGDGNYHWGSTLDNVRSSPDGPPHRGVVVYGPVGARVRRRAPARLSLAERLHDPNGRTGHRERERRNSQAMLCSAAWVYSLRPLSRP